MARLKLQQLAMMKAVTCPFEEGLSEYKIEEATPLTDGSFLILEDYENTDNMTKKERYEKALAWWAQTNPNATTELNFTNNFELLVAVMLSAQCTDSRVNQVTPALFKTCPTPEIMAKTESYEILEYIKSVSYPNAKAEHLHNMAEKLVKDYNGTVPDDFDALLSLPGVGRKTANVMLVVAFDKPAMPVDTHVFRVSNRIGLTNNAKTPIETEMELTRNIPQEVLSKAHHWILLHGRYICTAIAPKCEKCGLSDICKYYNKKK